MKTNKYLVVREVCWVAAVYHLLAGVAAAIGSLLYSESTR